MMQNLLVYNIRINNFFRMVKLFNDADHNVRCVTLLIRTLNRFLLLYNCFTIFADTDPCKWKQTSGANMSYFPAKLICRQRKHRCEMLSKAVEKSEVQRNFLYKKVI